MNIDDRFVLFFAEQFRSFCDDGGPEGWQELAENHGLVKPVDYDPEEHGNADADPGDLIYVLTDEAEAVIKEVRKKEYKSGLQDRDFRDQLASPWRLAFANFTPPRCIAMLTKSLY